MRSPQRTTEEADLCIDLPDLKEPDGLPICFRWAMADVLSYFAIKLMGGKEHDISLQV